VDPDYLREFTPVFTAIAIFCGVWYFIMPFVHRRLEKRVQTRGTFEIPLSVAELGLVWPLIGIIGVIIAFVFAITANSRVCMLCANHPDNVRGFGGGFCAYTEELKDSLRIDNTTNCIFVKESILGPGRRTWLQLGNRSQLQVTSSVLERKFTGSKGVHTLSIAANTRDDSDKVVLLHLEQNDTQPLTPFNETVDALGTFAQNESEPHDFAGSLGWGSGKLFMRSSRETVQLIVFRQDEMVCAFFGAMGVAILISVPWMETCDFDVQQDKVNRERWFCAPMSWMMPTNTGLCKLSNIKYVWLEIKDKASTGWLCVKLKAGRSTTMDAQLREIGRKDGEAEVMRIQEFLYKCHLSTPTVELTAEEREAFKDIDPPQFLDDMPPEPVQKKGRKNKYAQ